MVLLKHLQLSTIHLGQSEPETLALQQKLSVISADRKEEMILCLLITQLYALLMVKFIIFFNMGQNSL